MKQYTLAAIAFAFLTFPIQSFAKHYNSIRLNCEITGEEVSLTPDAVPGPRIRRIPYTDKVHYTVDQIVYISDRNFDFEGPLSYATAVNEADFLHLIDPSINSADSLDEGPVLDLEKTLQPFHNPSRLFIANQSAQTTVTLPFGRDQLVDLLVLLGSPTAATFQAGKETGFQEIDFSKSRYFPERNLLKEYKQKKNETMIEFTGWYGTDSLKTCYQLDPVGFSAPEDEYYNGIAYHICGTCQVDLLESSSKVYEPIRAGN